MIVIFCESPNVLNFLLFAFTNFSEKIYRHPDLLSHKTMILKMIWHVKQKVVECYIMPPPRLSYIY